MKGKIFTIFILFSFFNLYSQIGGYALNFDGTDDYVSIADNASIDFTSSQSYTIEAWIYADVLTSTNIGRAVLSKYKEDDASYWIRVNPDGSLNFDNLTTAIGVITTNKWYHIACVYKAGAGAYRKVFVNGTEKSLFGSVIGPTDGNDEPLKIGRHNNWANDWDGKIDEVRIWNVVKVESDIKAGMYRELAGNEAGLVAYYKMSNGSGTTLTDNQTEAANSGTINGAAWTVSGCMAGSRQALSFVDDANPDEYVEIANGSGLIASQSGITFECWVYPRTTTISNWQTDFEGLMSIRNSSLHPAFYLLRTGNNNVEGNIVVSTGTSRQVNCSLVPNEWQHYALVYDGSTIKIYRNGFLEGSGSITGQITNTTQPLHIGKMFYDSYNWPFDGLIDEVRVWTTARTESQIRENMMNTLTGKESGLVAYYRFDQYDGTTLYDISGNGNNGTINNMESGDWVASTAFNTWIGSGISTWSTAANWSSGSTPAATDNVGLYKWDLGNEATISGTPTVNNLLFSTTASPTLSSNFTVNGNLLLGKNLDIGNLQITLGTSGYLVEGNNRLFGSSGIIRIEKTWGTLTNLNAGGLGLVLTTNEDLGLNTVVRGHTEQTENSNKSILRYYRIFNEAKDKGSSSLSGGGQNTEALSVTLQFNYLESELNGLNENNLVLFKSTDQGVTWTHEGGILNTTDNNVTLNNVTNISWTMWTLGSSDSPLPVELKSFTASNFGKSVILDWLTNTEISNFGFEIERKSLTVDTGHALSLLNPISPTWDLVGFVSGAGNSNSVKDYSFTDKDIKGGKYQYRLKQIDNDGKFSYSEVIEVDVALPAEFKLEQNYPNPFNPTTTIEYQLPVNSHVKLELYSITGEKVATLIDTEMEAGYHNYKLSTINYQLSSGVYFYKLITNNYSSIKKMVLMK